MRNPNATILVLALGLAAALAPAAHAEFRIGRKTAAPRAPVQTFTVSGTLNGAIADQVRLDGQAYLVSPDVRVFEIGRGAVPAGTSYFDRVVTLNGERRRGLLVVHSVVVRPAAPFGGGTAGEAPENRPR